MIAADMSRQTARALIGLTLVISMGGCHVLERITGGADAGADSGAVEARSSGVAENEIAKAPRPAVAVDKGALGLGPACQGWTPRPIKTGKDTQALADALAASLKAATEFDGKRGAGGVFCDAFFATAGNVRNEFLREYGNKSNVVWETSAGDPILAGDKSYFVLHVDEESMKDAPPYLETDGNFDDSRRTMNVHVTVGADGRIIDWREELDPTLYRVAKAAAPWLPCTVVPTVPEASGAAPSKVDQKVLSDHGLVARLKPGSQVRAVGIGLRKELPSGSSRAVLVRSGSHECWAMAEYSGRKGDHGGERGDPDEPGSDPAVEGVFLEVVEKQ